MAVINSPGSSVSRSKLLRDLALLVIVCGITGAMIYKAAVASMTHDESSTYLNLVRGSTLPLWSCYANPECWTTANNHLLNTLLMRWSSFLGGPTEFALRMPNLLLLLISAFCVFRFVADTARNTGLALFGIALGMANPFVLDFFALARGYGMGLGFMTASLFGMWKYFKEKKPGYCAFAFLSATAAVFANLTYVAYVAALAGATSLWVIFGLRRRSTQLSGYVPFTVAASLIFLAVYFYRPVLILISRGEFDYGVTSLWESWFGFIRDSLYGRQWFGEQTVHIVSIGVALMAFAGVLLAWLPRREREDQALVSFYRFCSVLCVLFIATFIVNHLWTGAHFPSGRKSILYAPCIAFIGYLAVNRVAGKPGRWNQIVFGSAGVLILVHFVTAYSPHVYREWWYDASTKEMTEYVAQKASGDMSPTLGVEWIFHPSTQFYVETKDLPVRLAPYSKEISASDPVEYYFVHPEHVPKIESAFEVERNFDGRLLLQRKQ